MKRIGIIASISALLVFMLLEISFTFIAPGFIIKPFKSKENLKPSDFGMSYSKLEVLTIDSIKLRGYWTYQPNRKPQGVMILLHGFGSCKEHLLGLVKKLCERGYESVVFDSRAHGRSQGNYTTFGYYERDDVMQIVDAIKAKNDSVPIGIWGNSMGGAVALQALELDERIDFGVIESTFRDLEEIIQDYQKNIVGISMPYFARKAMRIAERMADFEIKRVRPIRSVQNIEQPVMMIHGDADERISVEYGKDLYRHLASKEKELFIVKGAGHYGLFDHGVHLYEKEMMNFIDKHMGVKHYFPFRPLEAD